MGLKNYNEQVAVIKQADRQVEKLKSYANSMNALIISLQSLWDDNVDQGTMLNAIGDCVYEAAGIYYDYNLFSVNAIRWLKNMDDLDKLVFSMVTGNTGKIQPFRSNYTGTSIPAKRNRIHVNPKDLKGFAQQVNGYNKTLDSIQAKTSGINNQIDKLILNKFASRYSLTNINRRIEKLKTHNAQVAKALSTIGEAYEAAENELKKYAEMMDFSAMSSGQVNGQIQKAATGAGGTKTKVQDKKTTDGSVAGEQQGNNAKENTTKVEIHNINTQEAALSQYGIGGDCNVTSQAMLLRRLCMRDGKDYQGINQDSVRGTVADGGQNVKYPYTYAGYTINCYKNDDAPFYNNVPFRALATSDAKSARLQDVLAHHPEGIVVWGSTFTKSGGEHAILLTKYENGQFYCCDPWQGAKEIPISESICTTDLSRVDQYYCLGNPR